MKHALTKARLAMLDQLNREPGSYAEYYPPMKWALENGYVVAVEGKYRTHFALTEAGRKLLSENSRP